jgi:hypothetical protein
MVQGAGRAKRLDLLAPPRAISLDERGGARGQLISNKSLVHNRIRRYL